MKLQDIYYGNAIPCQHDVRKDSDYAKRSLELLEMCDTLEKRLSADDKKLLNDITDMQGMLSETIVAESYIQGFNEMSGIKNYFNDFYARDTSKKIRAVFKAKGERGERVGTSIPYGYMKNPDNAKQLIPDPVTAPVVRQIYELCADGKGTRAICRYLEEHEIESPSVYEFHIKGTKSKHPDLEHPYLWTQSTVRDMLSNRVYCGDTPELLRAFISRIEVYEKPEKYSRTCGNTILIRYTFQTIHEPTPILKPSENKTFAQAAR